MGASQEKEKTPSKEISSENLLLNYSAVYGLDRLTFLRFSIDAAKDRLAEIDFVLNGDDSYLRLLIEVNGNLNDFFLLYPYKGNQFGEDNDLGGLETTLTTGSDKYTLQVEGIFFSWPRNKKDLKKLFGGLMEIPCPQEIPQNTEYIAGGGKYTILKKMNSEIGELLLGAVDFGLITAGEPVVSLQEGLRNIFSKQR